MNKITGYILLSFILLIGCKKYENNKFTTKYIKEEAVEYSLSPQLLPIDILNPTGIVAIDTFLVFVQRHENKIITRYWEIFFAKVMDLMKSFYLHDLISFFNKIMNLYFGYNPIPTLWGY